MAHVLHPRKAVAPPFMQKRLSDLDLHQIASCAPSGWPMQTLPDIPRMTPKPAWRVAVLQRPWRPDGRYGWPPAARAARTMVEGLIWLFLLASGRIPPVDCA